MVNIKALVKKQQEQHVRRRFISVIAILVGFSTIITLMLPAVALNHKKKVLSCAYVPHVHDDSCYAETLNEDGEVIDRTLICGMADYVIHVHNDDCFDASGDLVCPLPELEAHQHSDECYEMERVLVCGQEEGPEHTHSDACCAEERSLICDKPAALPHIHDESCCETILDEEGNVLAVNRVCGMEQVEVHVHGPACFTEVDMTPEEVAALGLQEAPAAEDEESPLEEEALTAQEEVVEDAVPDDTVPFEEEESIPEEELVLEDETVEADIASGEIIPEEESEEIEDESAAVIAVEEEPVEAPETEEAMPAQRFTAEAEGISVSAEAPEGALPAGAEMRLAVVEDEQVLETAADAVTGRVVAVKAVDITFADTDGDEIEPLIPICVTLMPLTEPELPDAILAEPVVVHVDDEGAAEVVERLDNMEEVIEPGGMEIDAVTSAEAFEETIADELVFEADTFSVYAIVYTVELHEQIITAEGETYEITVICDEGSGIPEDAALEVREIPEGTEEYTGYLNDSAEELGVDSSEVSFARFFDIKIVDRDGEKLEPTTPAQVMIAYVDALGIGLEDSLSVVHFGDEKTEVITDLELSEDQREIRYEQASFSVTGTVVASPAAGNAYMVLTKVHIEGADVYCIVNNDGTLTPVQNPEFNADGTIRTVYVDEPMLWRCML